MSNIHEARNMLTIARELRAAGDLSNAAECAVSAQRIAKQCRAAARNDIAWGAHSLIAGLKSRATEQRDRSNIGRALTESRIIGWDF